MKILGFIVENVKVERGWDIMARHVKCCECSNLDIDLDMKEDFCSVNGYTILNINRVQDWCPKIPLKIGDKVCMVNCTEAEEYKDKIFEVQSEPWKLGHGREVVLISGICGGFAVDCLKKV